VPGSGTKCRSPRARALRTSPNEMMVSRGLRQCHRSQRGAGGRGRAGRGGQGGAAARRRAAGEIMAEMLRSGLPREHLSGSATDDQVALGRCLADRRSRWRRSPTVAEFAFASGRAKKAGPRDCPGARPRSARSRLRHSSRRSEPHSRGLPGNRGAGGATRGTRRYLRSESTFASPLR
jgi:hypothetical protein